MAKIITKAVTRLQKFLAAIAGDAVAPTPITNQEKLLFNIAEEMKAASASDLPDIGSSDKNKYLHTNESTGDLEWATAGGSGGGVEIVRFNKTKSADSNTEGRCDHTLDELIQAYAAGKDILCYISDYNGFITPLGILMVSDDPQSTYAMTPIFMYSDETKNYRISVSMNADGVSVTRVEVQ